MIKLSILVKRLGPFQQGVNLIRNLNSLAEKHPQVNVTVFYEEYDRIPIQANFAILQNRYAWGYDGVMISTDIDTTHLMAGLMGPNKKIFYMWNLDWLYTDHMFGYYNAAYMNPEMELAVRDESVVELVTKVWRPPQFIIGDFDYEELTKIAEKFGEKSTCNGYGFVV